MSGPEASFRDGVHRLLPPLSELHREGMSNLYRGGTPDYWYSGAGDLWVEWKHIAIPKRPETMIDMATGGKKAIISSLQQEWIKRRHAEGRRVWVIVGSAEGGVIMQRPDRWLVPFPAAWFRAQLMSKHEIAQSIVDATDRIHRSTA